MPLTKFECPDKVQIPITECLKSCRMGQRCVTKATLLTIVAGRREWNGIPSTTQLLNGTMMEWLKATVEYAVSPRGSAFQLTGISHHQQLAQIKGNWETEKQLQGDTERSGISDLLEPDENLPGMHILTDYKNFGSYKVAQILGLEKEIVASPTEVYQRSGNWGRAGSPKMIPIFKRNPAKADYKDEALQLNHYRLLAEKQGFNISHLYLQITVRDGGTQVAEGRGVLENMYYPVELPIMPDSEVEAYFGPKAERLVHHVTTKTIPEEPCNNEEAWDGKRCLDYCEVSDFCIRGATERWKRQQKQG